MQTPEPDCINCKHYFAFDDEKFSCKAFTRIPDKIIDSEIKHNKVLPEQNNEYIFKKGNPIYFEFQLTETEL